MSYFVILLLTPHLHFSLKSHPTIMHTYAKWHGPLPNRRKRLLEESHLRVFTQLNDYHILKASCFGGWSLNAVFCHAFTTAASSLKSACAKPVLLFSGAEMFFSACFVLSVATCNANAKEFRSIIVLFRKIA